MVVVPFLLLIMGENSSDSAWRLKSTLEKSHQNCTVWYFSPKQILSQQFRHLAMHCQWPGKSLFWRKITCRELFKKIGSELIFSNFEDFSKNGLDVKQNQMSWPIVVSHHSSIGWISPAFNQTIMLNETPYILLVGSSSIAVLVGFPSMVGQNIVWLWQLVVHSDLKQWQIGCINIEEEAYFYSKKVQNQN